MLMQHEQLLIAYVQAWTKLTWHVILDGANCLKCCNSCRRNTSSQFQNTLGLLSVSEYERCLSDRQAGWDCVTSLGYMPCEQKGPDMKLILTAQSFE